MSDAYYKEVFSKNLKYYMSLNGKTQVDIINELGYDKSAVSTWCNGSRLPRMDKVDALAKYLGIRRSDLIEERIASPSEETAKESQSGKKYYFSDETAEMAQRLFEDQDLRMLFDASRDSRPEDLKMAADMLKRFKGTNPDE